MEEELNDINPEEEYLDDGLESLNHTATDKMSGLRDNTDAAKDKIAKARDKFKPKASEMAGKGGEKALEKGVEKTAIAAGSAVAPGVGAAAKAAEQLSKVGEKLGISKKKQFLIGCLITIFPGIIVLVLAFATMSAFMTETAPADEIEKAPSLPVSSELISPPNLGLPNALGYYQMPPSIDNLYSFYGCTYGNTPGPQHWGNKKLVDILYTVATKLAAKYPGSKLQVGDLNAFGHASHKNGIDVDIDIPNGMIDDGSGYNQQIAIDAAKFFFETKSIVYIFYNDGTVRTGINLWASSEDLPGEMQASPGHGNHFHVRIIDEKGQINAPGC